MSISRENSPRRRNRARSRSGTRAQGRRSRHQEQRNLASRAAPSHAQRSGGRASRMRRPFLPRDFIFHFQCFWRRHCFYFHRVSETPTHQSRTRDGSDRRSRTCPDRSNNHGACRKPERIAPAVLSSSYSPDRNPNALGRKHREAGTVGRMAITGACGAVGAQSKLDSRPGNLP
jgi:hypothetical protein